MESVSYGDFSARLHRRIVSRRVPIDGTIEVTWRCPLRCSHCYNNLPMNDSRARDGELSFEEHCRILDEITESGCLWLLYTGGEVFARSDFLDIYLHARKNGLLVSLFTNGTLITPRAADCLARWTPLSIEITLYGRTRETYERLTGTPGSFDRCMRGIRLLTERRLPLKIKTMAVSINKHEIWDMKRFVEEDLGLEFRFDASINPRIDCSRGPLTVRLAPVEVVELDLLDRARIAEWKRFASQFNGPALSPSCDSELYQCGAGIDFVLDQPAWETECLRDVAIRHVRPAQREFQDRMGGPLAGGTLQENHQDNKVPVLRDQVDVRDVPCQRRPGGGRSRVPGRLPVPGSALAILCSGDSDIASWRLCLLPGGRAL